MARLLLIGDLHFKASNLVEGEELVRKLIEKRDELCGIDAIVLLGDLLDNHATVHSQAFNLVHDLLLAFQAENIFVLVGNHDYINNSQFLTTQHPFNVFKKWGNNIHIVDDLTEWKHKGQNFVFLPYVPVGRFMEALQKKQQFEDNGSIDYIFAHQEFEGSVFTDKGDEWPYETHVISGHIHGRRNLKTPNSEGTGNVFYLGSPIQHSFAETPDKAIAVLDTLTGIFEYYPLDMPQKHTIEIDLANIDTLVLPEKSSIRLRLKCTCSSWAVFKKSKKYKELMEAKVKVQPLAIDDEIQLKKMAKKRTTYIESLKTYADKSGGYVQEAFDLVMGGLSA
jgi:DNA repair exonuclease SbcCD nuclease subunit